MMYNKKDKLTMVIGGVGLALILAFANASDSQSGEIVDGHEKQVNGIASKQEGTIEAFSYAQKPQKFLSMHIEKKELLLTAGSQYPLEISGNFEEHKVMDIANHPDMVYTSSNGSLVTVEEGLLQVADTAITGDDVTITCTYQGISESLQVRIKQSLEDTVELDDEGNKILLNHHAIDVLVNKERNMPSSYVPDDLIEPQVDFSFSGQDEKRNMKRVAAEALEKMFQEAEEEESLYLVAVSGYRSYKRQLFLHNYKIKKYGLKATKKVSAMPGQSEHQTGLAMDISCRSIGNKLNWSFGDQPEGIWLRDNAHRYGFIIRYPKGKEDITGYSYEPWHVRYLGVDLATKVYESGLCYEEYLENQ